MPNTYTQIHIHTVFAVQNRLCLIDKSWRDRLYQYIVSIIQNNGHKVLAIGGVADYVHILFGFRPTESLSHLMQEVKRDSSTWINANHFVKGKFSWQEGFGAFPIARAKYLMYAIILKPKKSTIGKEPSQRNTLIFWKNLELNMINDTFLTQSNDIMAHPHGMYMDI